MPATALLRRPVVLLTAGLVALAAAGCWHIDAQSKPAANPCRHAARALDADETNNINVFKKTSPSVVHITNLALQRDLFSLRVTEQPQGTGTGFIWDENGHIVTNFPRHPGRQRGDGDAVGPKRAPGQAGGRLPDRDLAVLRVDVPKEKLAPIAIGTSWELQVGQKVYAIGNPLAWTRP